MTSPQNSNYNPLHLPPYQIKSLQNQILHERLKKLVAYERKVTHEILLHLMEVDRRKLYLEMAYPSLWEYLVSGIGYSAPAAQRRIDAARLMIQVPELGKKLEVGSISLAQVSLLQKTIREVKKQTGFSVPAEFKQKVVQKLEYKNTQQTELVLAQAFEIRPKTQLVLKTQKDESVRLEITFSKEEIEFLEDARSLCSHSLLKIQDVSYKGLILYCVQRVVKLKRGL